MLLSTRKTMISLLAEFGDIHFATSSPTRANPSIPGPLPSRPRRQPHPRSSGMKGSYPAPRPCGRCCSRCRVFRFTVLGPFHSVLLCTTHRSPAHAVTALEPCVCQCFSGAKQGSWTGAIASDLLECARARANK
jgi:hypothetical protein